MHRKTHTPTKSRSLKKHTPKKTTKKQKRNKQHVTSVLPMSYQGTSI